MISTVRRMAKASNDIESLSMAPQERILSTVSEVYDGTSPALSADSVGLQSLVSDSLIALTVQKPHRKVTVMIVGNRSVGKSTFINWYVGERITATGGQNRRFSIITSGKRRETISGDAALLRFDRFGGLEAFEGIMPTVLAEVSTSKERSFPCVDFIDTPGLDESVSPGQYDVDGAVLWLADRVDLIMVFFDPIGQALVGHTLDLLRQLSENHRRKLRFYVSRADQLSREDDRRRVLRQISGSLQNCVPDNLRLSMFYIPPLSGRGSSPADDFNNIEELCKDIEQAVEESVQKKLQALKSDCKLISDKIRKLQLKNVKVKELNRARKRYGISLTLAAWGVFGFILLLAFRFLLLKVSWLYTSIKLTFDSCPHSMFLSELLDESLKEHRFLKEENHVYLLGILGFIYILLLVCIKVLWKTSQLLSTEEILKLKSFQQSVSNILKLHDVLSREYNKVRKI